MRRPTADDTNKFVASLAKQDRNRDKAFFDRLTDAERCMTIDEFCKSRLSSDPVTDSADAQLLSVVYLDHMQ